MLTCAALHMEHERSSYKHVRRRTYGPLLISFSMSLFLSALSHKQWVQREQVC
jgi:hypothetical protein